MAVLGAEEHLVSDDPAIDELMRPAKVRRLRLEYDYLVQQRAIIAERLSRVRDQLWDMGEQP